MIRTIAALSACAAPVCAEIQVKWEAGKLSLDAERAALPDVLAAVARKTGIEVIGAERAAVSTSAHFSGMDLMEALREILSPVDYGIAASPPGEGSARDVRVVVVRRAASKDPARTAKDAPGPEASRPAAESGLASVEEAARTGDREALRARVADTDPAVQSSAFRALAAQNSDAAVEKLAANLKDTSLPTRLQSLQLLAQSSAAGETTIMTALREAVTDPDPSLGAFAVQALAARGNTEAIDVLREAFHTADPATRVTIVQGAPQTEAGMAFLREAMADSDETVRAAAETQLQQAAAANPAAGKP